MATAEQTSARIFIEARLKVLKTLVRRDRVIAKKYKAKIQSLQRQLRNGTGDVSEKVTQAMGELAEEIQPDIVSVIETGSIAGKQAARDTFKTLFGQRARAVFPTDADALRAAGDRIRGRTTIDKVSLSKRLWKANQSAGKKMATAITDSMRAGGSMDDIAAEILKRGAPKLTPPEYAVKLAEAARHGGDELAKVSAKYQKQLNKLGSAAGYNYGMRPVVQDFQAALAKARPNQIDRIVDRFMVEKAQKHAQMIARTETIEAYRESYKKSNDGQGWVKGYRWSLGGSHPKPDVCDILAGQDMYGLGAGGYPEDALPETPHPNDMCIQTAIIDKDHFKRKTAKLKGEKAPAEVWKSGKKETSEQWLRKQPTAAQKQILGPTKYEAFQQKVPVLGKNGIPKRVKDLQVRSAASPERLVTVQEAAAQKKLRWYDKKYDEALGSGTNAEVKKYSDLRRAQKKLIADKYGAATDPLAEMKKLRAGASSKAVLAKKPVAAKPVAPRKRPVRKRPSKPAALRDPRYPKGMYEGPTPTEAPPQLPKGAKGLAQPKGETNQKWYRKQCGGTTDAVCPLKPDMTLAEAQKAIANKDVEHFMAWGKGRKGFYRAGGNSPKQANLGPNSRRLVNRTLYDLHNHPSDAAMFSFGDLVSAQQTNLLSEMHIITKSGRGARMKIVDFKKWKSSWSGTKYHKFVDEVEAADKAIAKTVKHRAYKSFYGKADPGYARSKTAQDAWRRAYEQEANGAMNKLGKDWGFEIETYQAW